MVQLVNAIPVLILQSGIDLLVIGLTLLDLALVPLHHLLHLGSEYLGQLRSKLRISTEHLEEVIEFHLLILPRLERVKYLRLHLLSLHLHLEG
jgi:hypothetical protein